MCVLDPGSWIQDPRSWIQDPGSGILDPGSGIQDPGSMILDPESWIQDPGSRIMDPGFRVLDKQSASSQLTNLQPSDLAGRQAHSKGLQDTRTQATTFLLAAWWPADIYSEKRLLVRLACGALQGSPLGLVLEGESERGRMGIQDPGSWIQDPGSCILDPRPWIQDPGSRILDLNES